MGLGIVLTLIGVDSFWVEPNLLTVTKYVVKDEKFFSPNALFCSQMYRLTPSIVKRISLSDGCWIHPRFVGLRRGLSLPFWKDYQVNTEPFKQLLFEYGLDKTPSIVVEGDAEYHWGNQWHALLKGRCHHGSVRRTLWGDIEIMGLTMMDSKYGEVYVNSNPKRFSILVGHNPNFALEQPLPDLYLAGHTHGGQVVLPFLGPLITFSDLPNAQVSGRTDFPNGSTLIVSQGIGMERYDAPRLRFLCPPELVVIDLMPMD